MLDIRRSDFVLEAPPAPARFAHVQALDMLRLAAAAEVLGQAHRFPAHVLVALDLDAPVPILERDWMLCDGEPIYGILSRVELTTAPMPVAVRWYAPVDAFDEAVFEIRGLACRDSVDLCGLVAALEGALDASLGDLLR